MIIASGRSEERSNGAMLSRRFLLEAAAWLHGHDRYSRGDQVAWSTRNHSRLYCIEARGV